MKRVLIFISLFLTIACSKARKEPNTMENDVLKESSMMDAEEEFQYQNISKQKLQDLFDLLVLQKKHPEFNNDIANQLKEISEDSIVISDNIKTASIENIAIIEPVRKLSDSTQIMKIDFDIVSNLGISKDSLLVTIKTKKIVLDNQKLESNKLVFKRLE